MEIPSLPALGGRKEKSMHILIILCALGRHVAVGKGRGRGKSKRKSKKGEFGETKDEEEKRPRFPRDVKYEKNGRETGVSIFRFVL
jgi:hypothetical protein